MIDLEALKTAVGDLDDESVSALLAEVVQAGGEGAAEALIACQEGMDIVGEKYESGEYFVADLIFAGDLMSEAAGTLKQFLAADGAEALGKVIICTVKGDIHDIGKNIVKALLEAAGIECIDLGVDASAEAILEACKANQGQVIALSGVLTLAIDSMKETVEAFTAAGVRDYVKFLIGGAPVTADYCKLVGADAWALSAAEGVGIVRGWLA